MNYNRLNGLSSDDYAYPGENTAFKKLEQIPNIDVVVGKILQLLVEIDDRPQVHGDCYQVTEITNPHIFHLYQTALERLDMSETYPLYLDAQFDYNACAYGGSAPFIVVNSSIIRNFTDDEILAIIGHEIGHIKGRHSIYSFLASKLGRILQTIPQVGSYITAAFTLALTQWERMHEFSCDRAGCIAAGSVDASINAMRSLLGASDNLPYVKCDIDTLMKQSSDFDISKENKITAAYCGFLLINAGHPWTIDRIKELVKWKESGEFTRLIDRFQNQ